MSHNQLVGAKGEDAVARWYCERGYELLDRNWRPGPGALNPRGELDLVLQQDDVVVFCEVKTRTSNRFGSGVYAVGRTKQQSLRRLASQWLKASDQAWAGMRFDVAVVDPSGEVRAYQSCF